jgi:hypothetical protein
MSSATIGAQLSLAADGSTVTLTIACSSEAKADELFDAIAAQIHEDKHIDLRLAGNTALEPVS